MYNYTDVCMMYTNLYHAIENTAYQNAGKPSYLRWYYTQPSHDALRFYFRRNLVSGTGLLRQSLNVFFVFCVMNVNQINN